MILSVIGVLTSVLYGKRTIFLASSSAGNTLFLSSDNQSHRFTQTSVRDDDAVFATERISGRCD